MTASWLRRRPNPGAGSAPQPPLPAGGLSPSSPRQPSSRERPGHSKARDAAAQPVPRPTQDRGAALLSARRYDCFCGDGHCDAQYENWLNCSLDCASPTCGNGVCECTRNGQWGSELCCFDDYYASSEPSVQMYQSDWTDDVAPSHTPGCDVNTADTPGPETQQSCPFDCGVPCPPFCDSRVCVDSARLYAGGASEVEVAHRPAGESVWLSTSVSGALLSHKLRQLQPESRYEVRARARHAGGWGGWTEHLSLSTVGAVTAGQCIQDDAACDERDGEVLRPTTNHTHHAHCTR